MLIVLTNNSKFKNGECVDTYHEMHQIDNLNGFDHVVATIKSIVKNNLEFKSRDTKLVDVYISYIDDKVEKEVINYFKENPFIGIKVLKI